jgi:ABC-type lipoprotein release transport system permease subunit
VTLITESFWRTRFQRDPKILGRTLTINDQPYTIIGVVPDAIPGWINATYNQQRGSALDPGTLRSASVALIAIAFAACALPGRRGARIDPMQALRTE